MPLQIPHLTIFPFQVLDKPAFETQESQEQFPLCDLLQVPVPLQCPHETKT